MQIKILQGCVMSVLPTLPAASVHCCVTSPPYWGLRDYGIPPSVWGGDPSHEHVWGDAIINRSAGYDVGEKARWNHRENGRGESQERILAKDESDAGWARKDVRQGQFCECGAWLGAFGLEPTPELYIEHAVMIFREVHRVLRDDGTLWLNVGDSYSNDTSTSGGKNYTSAAGGYQGQRLRRGKDCDPKRGKAAVDQPMFACKENPNTEGQGSIVNKSKFADEQLLDALTQAKGKVSEAAKIVGCSERVFYGKQLFERLITAVENKLQPIIALNCDISPSGYAACPLAYVDCVVAAGGSPVILVAGCELPIALPKLDGLIMIGGADLDPENDNFQRHPSQRLMHPRREVFDRELVHEARERKIPLLAIGAGMQCLNVVCGGSLFFDIATDLPKRKNAIPHFHNGHCPRDELCRHRVVVERESFIGGIFYGREYIKSVPEACIVSAHHMAVDDVAAGFKVTARAPDGVIEAIESIDLGSWWAVGVQWRPEDKRATKVDRLIFEQFVNHLIETKPSNAKERQP